MQDQAFLGPESGLAVPDGRGGVDLYISTQWLHIDQDQVAESLGPGARAGAAHPLGRGRRVRGAGGPLDADPRLHARARHGPPGEDGIQPRGVLLRARPSPPCQDALRARGDARWRARLRQGPPRLRRRRLRLQLQRRLLERGDLRLRPLRRAQRGYRELTCSTPTTRRAVPCAASARSRSASPTRPRWTGSPRARDGPRGAAHEERAEPGDAFPFGQEVPPPAPVREILERVRDMPLPEEEEVVGRDLRRLPGGVSNVTHGEAVRRGVGYAVGFKNIGFSAGFDDYSTARVILSVEDGEPLAQVHTAAAEVGQGLVDDRGPDRAHRARRREGGRAPRGHAGWVQPAPPRPRARPT